MDEAGVLGGNVAAYTATTRWEQGGTIAVVNQYEDVISTFEHILCIVNVSRALHNGQCRESFILTSLPRLRLGILMTMIALAPPSSESISLPCTCYLLGFRALLSSSTKVSIFCTHFSANTSSVNLLALFLARNRIAIVSSSPRPSAFAKAVAYSSAVDA